MLIGTLVENHLNYIGVTWIFNFILKESCFDFFSLTSSYNNSINTNFFILLDVIWISSI